MLAKKFRFHGYGSLKFVYSKGKTVRSKYLSMKFIENTRRGSTRVAIVVSKKVSKKAPQRNRIRRRLYEIVRERFAMIKPGYDIVITVFDERVADIDAKELASLVDELIAQAHITKQ